MFAVDTRSIHREPMVKHREEILDWLWRHGIDTNLAYEARVIGPFIRVKEYELSANGRKFIVGDKFADRIRWVRLRRRPPRTGAI